MRFAACRPCTRQALTASYVLRSKQVRTIECRARARSKVSASLTIAETRLI